MRKVAIYARFSSDQQSPTSIDDQISACERYAKINDMCIDSNHVYFDAATSGSLLERQGLNKLLKAAKDRSFDIVLVDDLSRLARSSAQIDTHIKRLAFMNITLISVADNLDTSDEDSKIVYQIKGIFAEYFLDDLRKKTVRGQRGKVDRGFFIGEHTYGYKSIPFGDAVTDKRGKPRYDGSKMHFVPEEVAVIRRIFQMYDDGKSVTGIVKELNKDKTPTSKNMNWSPSTIHRFLRNEKYVGHWLWGKMQNNRDPDTGIIRQTKRAEPLSDKTLEDLRIIPQDQWNRVQTRLKEVEKNWPTKNGETGFTKNQDSYAKTNPKELLSRAMVCSVCGGAIAKVSGKGGKKEGYYGCMKAARGACSNKLMVRKTVAETIILAEISKIIDNPKALQYILKNVKQLVAEMCATVPEELQLKKAEVANLEKAVQRLVKFIIEEDMEGGSKAIATKLQETEQRLAKVENELLSLESAHKQVFKTPPIEWIADRVSCVKELLEEKTEQSALLLRKLLGQITLEPVTPAIGKPYLLATSKLQPLALVNEERPPKGPLAVNSNWDLDPSSNSLQYWYNRVFPCYPSNIASHEGNRSKGRFCRV